MAIALVLIAFSATATASAESRFAGLLKPFFDSIDPERKREL
jgi:hypothetical protein